MKWQHYTALGIIGVWAIIMFITGMPDIAICLFISSIILFLFY